MKAKQINDERESLVKRNNELKERIQAIRIEKAKHEPELNKMKDRKNNLSKQLKDKKKEAHNLQKEEETLMNQEMALKNALETMRGQKEMWDEKDKILGNQIVSSPDKLTAELENLKGQKLDKEKQLEIFNSNIAELVEKQKDFPRIEALLDNLLLSLKKIADEIEKRNELAKEREDLSEAIGELRLKSDDLTRASNGRRELLASRKEQLAKFKQQGNMRLADYQKEITKLKEQISSLEQEINESEVVSSALDEQCRNCRKEINKLERDHEEFVARCNEKHEKLMTAVKTLDKKNKQSFEFYDDIDNQLNDVNEKELFDD